MNDIFYEFKYLHHLRQLNFWCECGIIGKKCICCFWNSPNNQRLLLEIYQQRIQGSPVRKDNEKRGGGGGGGTLFISHFSKLLCILSRISEMFYPLKVPFSNFVLSRLQFFHLFDLWPLNEVS